MRFPASLQIMWASVNTTSDKCWGWTLIFSSEEIKNYFRNSQSQDSFFIASMDIEKSFLKKLLSQSILLDDVIIFLPLKTQEWGWIINNKININYV
jgi:hypothetical protein